MAFEVANEVLASGRPGAAADDNGSNGLWASAPSSGSASPCAALEPSPPAPALAPGAVLVRW
jgi:hypothetical protein